MRFNTRYPGPFVHRLMEMSLRSRVRANYVSNARIRDDFLFNSHIFANEKGGQ
jgi:hypothetical protein